MQHPMTKLLPFPTEIYNAWKLFVHRWGAATLLQALTLIPGVLLLPLVTEYLLALENGMDTTVVFQTSAYAGQFVLGLVLMILLGIFVAASTGILFAARKKVSLREVITSTIVRYIPVLYTSFLAAFAVIVSLIPALALNYWYGVFARQGATVTGNGVLAVDAIVLIAVVALLVPSVIIAVWVMYAPLAVALKAAPAGFTAIMFSKHLVHRHVWQITWRMIGTMVLFQIASASVSALPYVSFLVPFILSIIIIAFFVEIYKELHQDQA
jgi:hypothetical protein